MPRRKQETPAISMMTHTILLQPKAETSDEALASLLKGVHALQKSIPCLISTATGENQSTRHKGFTHGIVLHFTDEVHMRDALTQSAYQKLQAKILTLCDQTITFEIPESIPLPAIETKARPEDQQSEPGQKETRQKQGASARPPQSPPATNWATIRRVVQNHHVRQIDPRLTAIVVDQLQVEEDEVVPNASLVEDLGADSLDLVEFIMELEEKFHLEIPDEDAEFLTTIGKSQAYLEIREAF